MSGARHLNASYASSAALRCAAVPSKPLILLRRGGCAPVRCASPQVIEIVALQLRCGCGAVVPPITPLGAGAPLKGGAAPA